MSLTLPSLISPSCPLHGCSLPLPHTPCPFLSKACSEAGSHDPPHAQGSFSTQMRSLGLCTALPAAGRKGPGPTTAPQPRLHPTRGCPDPQHCSPQHAEPVPARARPGGPEPPPSTLGQPHPLPVLVQQPDPALRSCRPQTVQLLLSAPAGKDQWDPMGTPDSHRPEQ